MYTYDAPWHRGRDVADPYPISTERFVSDLGDAVAALGRPAVMVGHSMGALHSWCLAADRPELVSARGGRGHGARLPRPHHRARGSRGCTRFRPNSIRPKKVYDEFGQVAGQYFLEAFDRTATGWRLHGHTSYWIEIAAEWGTRDYWKQWKAVAGPRAAPRGGQFRHPAGADAQNAGNRLPDNVFARSRSRSPDPRRCAADLPGGGRVVPSDARPSRLRRARTAASQSVCGSRRRRVRRGSRRGRPRTAGPSSGRTNGTGRSGYEASQSDGRPS